MSKQIRLRIRSKAQNLALAKLVDRFGSIKKAARELRVNPVTFSAWLNLQGLPGFLGKTSYDALVRIQQLEELTGESITDIFPIDRKDLGFLAAERVRDVEIPLSCLADFRKREVRLLEAPQEPFDEVERQELWELVERNQRLSPKAKQIVRSLARGSTLKEVGRMHHVSVELVRQVAGKAYRILAQDPRFKQWIGQEVPNG